jgi:hypothetical protein
MDSAYDDNILNEEESEKRLAELAYIIHELLAMDESKEEK